MVPADQRSVVILTQLCVVYVASAVVAAAAACLRANRCLHTSAPSSEQYTPTTYTPLSPKSSHSLGYVLIDSSRRLRFLRLSFLRSRSFIGVTYITVFYNGRTFHRI